LRDAPAPHASLLFVLVGAAITLPIPGYAFYRILSRRRTTLTCGDAFAWFVGLWLLGVSPMGALLKSALSAATH
jgi:hypothetical protein